MITHVIIDNDEMKIAHAQFSVQTLITQALNPNFL